MNAGEGWGGLGGNALWTIENLEKSPKKSSDETFPIIVLERWYIDLEYRINNFRKD